MSATVEILDVHSDGMYSVDGAQYEAILHQIDRAEWCEFETRDGATIRIRSAAVYATHYVTDAAKAAADERRAADRLIRDA